MDTPTEPKHWRTVLNEQGRSLTWLASMTGRPRRSIYAYSRGDMRPTKEWLEAASRALGQDVAA